MPVKREKKTCILDRPFHSVLHKSNGQDLLNVTSWPPAAHFRQISLTRRRVGTIRWHFSRRVRCDALSTTRKIHQIFGKPVFKHFHAGLRWQNWIIIDHKWLGRTGKIFKSKAKRDLPSFHPRWIFHPETSKSHLSRSELSGLLLFSPWNRKTLRGLRWGSSHRLPQNAITKEQSLTTMETLLMRVWGWCTWRSKVMWMVFARCWSLVWVWITRILMIALLFMSHHVRASLMSLICCSKKELKLTLKIDGGAR